MWFCGASLRSDVVLRENQLIFIRVHCVCESVLEHRRADAPPSLRHRATERPYVCGSRSGMDQGSATGTGGTFISLSDTEQRCFSGLYALCQPDSSGKLAAGKVAELFRASQLPAETLHQVSLRGIHRRPSSRSSIRYLLCLDVQSVCGGVFRTV